MIDQGALAVERVRLVEDMDVVKRTVETDRLRSALLTSISHDLKTPLAAVLGSASTLRDLADKLSDAEKTDLLGTMIDESERLNRFIANLLDMTKLESGAIVPNTARRDVHEVVGTALRRASKILAYHHVELQLATDLPMVDLDAVLFEQDLLSVNPISKADVLEHNVAADRRQRRARLVENRLGGRVEDVTQSVDRDARLVEVLPDLGKPQDWHAGRRRAFRQSPARRGGTGAPRGWPSRAVSDVT